MLPTRTPSRGTLRFVALPGGEGEGGRPQPGGDADRRRHPRISAPALTVGYGGETFATADWSLGGLALSGYEGNLTTGSLFTIDRLATVGGGFAAVRISARVVRRDRRQRRLSVSFLHMDRRAFALLEAWMAERDPDPEHKPPQP
jgi:hypothetical protein